MTPHLPGTFFPGFDGAAWGIEVSLSQVVKQLSLASVNSSVRHLPFASILYPTLINDKYTHISACESAFVFD